MGHSQADKAETHRRILQTAARQMREEGLDGLAVADLMKHAGLTVGGFYKHFASRDELVAEALESVDSEWSRTVAEGKARGQAEPKIFADAVDRYLSENHRDHLGAGCIFAALAGDIARSGRRPREIATAKMGRAFDVIARLFPNRRARDARTSAIVAFCALVGALVLARVATDEELSAEILRTVAKMVKGLGG